MYLKWGWFRGALGTIGMEVIVNKLKLKTETEEGF